MRKKRNVQRPNRVSEWVARIFVVVTVAVFVAFFGANLKLGAAKQRLRNEAAWYYDQGYMICVNDYLSNRKQLSTLGAKYRMVVDEQRRKVDIRTADKLEITGDRLYQLYQLVGGNGYENH